jgi:excisionase family DNA binding protein
MDERLTVAEAAERLGITKEAVRKRIHRGTLRSEKAPDGTVMVYVLPSTTESGTPSSPDRDLLYEEMRERIRYLERQVEEERESRRRADTLLARLMDRVPEIEPPSAADASPAPSQASEEASQEARRTPGVNRAAPGGVEPPAASERVSWWRRVFGS